MKNFSIAGRQIGDGNPCYITYEAGPTHAGVESAVELVRLAAKAGADAVKFQMLDPDRLVADRKLPFTYEVLVDRVTGKTEAVTEPLYDILSRRYLAFDDWKKVAAAASDVGVAFFATAGFDEEVDFLESLGCDTIKIASSDVTHFPLIRRAARTGMCIQLDTGNSTLAEIEMAVDVIRSEGNNRIVIHQCASGYPAKVDSINLRMIVALKTMFPFPIAFSDHSPGWDMDIAALAMGANMVEKTITKDRTTRSVEHMFSLEGDDLPLFVKTIRDVETAMGYTRRILTEADNKRRLTYRRSVFTRKALRAGDVIDYHNVEFRRPGFGLSPAVFETLVGKKLAVDLEAGVMLRLHDLVGGEAD